MRRLVLLLVWGMALVGLSGCVRYDLGIHYFSQTRGEIVQQIRLGESVTQFNGAIARDWLQALEQRARQVGGNTQRRSPQEITVRIPFYNGADLEDKFNRFFAPAAQEELQAEGADAWGTPDATGNPDAWETAPLWPEIQAHLAVQEQNFLLVQRNRLVYDLDVRSLTVLSPSGSVLVGPGALLELGFSLDTPWGAHPLSGSLPPRSTPQVQHLMWSLKTTEPTHIDVSFWVPSPLGIGTVAIALMVGVGAALKARLPAP